MLDFDPRFLGAVSIPGVLNISRPLDTVSWSRDNQVALITDGGGVFVVDFVHSHGVLETESTPFVGTETKILCTKSNLNDFETYTGISLPAVLKSKEKSEIFDIVRDPVLSPKDLNNSEVRLYFTKVSWSENALKVGAGDYGKCQYILGVLDSHFRLQLFTRKLDFGEDVGPGVMTDDDWDICVDFTESYRQMLLMQFWSVNVDEEESLNLFQEYKRRMYELATVNFSWLPTWEDSKKSGEGQTETYFITAHASGDFCIWKLSVHLEGTKPMFFLTLEFRKNLIPGEIVSTLSFHKISSSLGILAVGTTTGSVRVFPINYNSLIPMSMKQSPDDDEPQPQKYVFGEGRVLCENDNIEVQRIFCDTEQSSAGRGNIFVVKHPNFLLSFRFNFNGQNEIKYSDNARSCRLVQGTLVGIELLPKMKFSDTTVAIAISQRGILKRMSIKDGKIGNESSIDLSALEEQGNVSDRDPGQLKKRFQFGGLAISPNTTMLCVSKTLAEYYDHLALRTPSILQFHSLFPTTDVWKFVYAKCLENNFLLQKMNDVLASFRVLMTFSDHYLKEVLDWAVPLSSRSINELQILYWILRVQPRVNQDQLLLSFNLRREQLGPFLTLKYQNVRTYRRETLVSDKIMQLRCWNLVDKIVAKPDKYKLRGNSLNLQSLLIMYEYLESKKKLIQEKGPLPLKPRVLVDPPPRQPACTLCGKPTKMINPQNAQRWVKNEDYIVEHDIDAEEIDGVLWHELEHQQKSRSHPITSCILSMVPASFPYRKCNFCGTISNTKPSFNQEPICPLCNGLMECTEGYLQNEEEDVITEHELKELVLGIKKEQERDAALRKQAEPSTSKTARIEKMYIDS